MSRFDTLEDALEAFVAGSFRASPACRLEVGHDDDFFLRKRRDLEDAVDRAEARGEVGAAVRHDDFLELLEHFIVVRGRVPDNDPGRITHDDQTDRVAASGVAHELRGEFLGAVEAGRSAVGVPHAEGAVEHEHSVGASPRERGHCPEAFEERFGHRADDEHDDHRPHREQEPLLDPDPLRVLPHGGDQEPHRGPRLFAEPAAVEQVDDQRQRRRGEAVDEGGVRQPDGQNDRRLQRRLLSSALVLTPGPASGPVLRSPSGRRPDDKGAAGAGRFRPLCFGQRRRPRLARAARYDDRAPSSG